MDVKKYRKEQESKVAEAAKKLENRDREAMLETMSDASATQKNRIAAIEEHGPEMASVKSMIAILRDKSEAAPVRLAAIAALQAAAFQVVAFAPHRAAFLTALRSVIRDDEQLVRERAINALAMEKDGDVQSLLLEGLRNPDRALVPAEQALNFLSYDLHEEHYPVARELLNTDPAPEVKMAALRVLSADAASKEMFARILDNENENSEVRRISAAALRAVDAKSFRRSAIDIIGRETDDPEVAASLLVGVTHLATPPSAQESKKLKAHINKLEKKKTKSAALKSSVRAYKEKFDK